MNVFDPANRNIYGVFETMRTYGGKIFMLEAHLKRLEESANLLSIKLPKPISEIRQMVLKKIKEYTSKYPLRIKVVATLEEIFVGVWPLKIDPKIYSCVKVICLELERDKPQEAKALPFYKSFKAHQLAEKKGCFEALLVDADGFVREGAYSNVFWVKNGQVFTTGEGILKGITRSIVCSFIPVKIGRITPQQLKESDEIFITKTTTGVTGIIMLDDVSIGYGKVGPVTQKLQLYFSDLENTG